MSKYTVVFAHTFPKILGGEVAMLHYSFEEAASPEEAAQSYINGLGGYGFLITVMEGHVPAILKGKSVCVWDNVDKYKTEELDVPVFEPKKRTPPTKAYDTMSPEEQWEFDKRHGRLDDKE